MKRKHALTEESEPIDMVVTSDDHATKEIMLDARFTSFLELSASMYQHRIYAYSIMLFFQIVIDIDMSISCMCFIDYK